MERLTERYSGTHVCYKNEYKNTALCSEMTIPQIRECMEKLAAYEDTGLEPEEVYKTIKAGVPEWIPKYLEYRKLEQQGLLIKLSCKVGDTVYWISPFRSGINQGKIEFININKFGFDLAIMGQEGVLIRRELEKVFLTREEAEKELERLSKSEV